MNSQSSQEASFSLFAGHTKIASEPLSTLLPKAKSYLEQHGESQFLFFSDETGAQMDFNLSGAQTQIEIHTASEHEPQSPRGRGRPKLGVVSREVSLLPRHWQWLELQPGGASATLRKLVEQASKANTKEEAKRRALHAAGKFMWAMAGNLPGFEEASRALYAGDLQSLQERISHWPADICQHVIFLSTDRSVI